MSHFTIKPADWPADSSAIKAVRSTVFIEEQQVPERLEWDGLDDRCHHWLAYDGNTVIGTCRMQADGHIGRMAVLKAYRGKGVGARLLNHVIEQATSLQLFEVYLYAQQQALRFYQKSGFIVTGEPFEDAGIPHQTMRKQLAEQRLLGVHGGDFKVTNLAETQLDLVSQASKQLRILSFDLNHKLFDTPDMYESLSKLARSSRYTEIRIMVVDPVKIIKLGHRLLTLHRRLPSNILLRRSTALPHEVKDNLIIADGIGVLNQSMRDPEKIWANYNNRPVAENYTVLFDELWEHAVVDKNLAQLSL